MVLLPALSATAQDGFEAGGWRVGAESLSNGERACVATAPGTGDPHYTFTLIDRDFIITLLSTRIDWPAGQTVSATLVIDDRWSRRMDVSAGFPSLLFFEFPSDDEIVERLRTGRVFRIDTARGPHKLNLSGSSAALAALWACGGRGVAPGTAAAGTTGEQGGTTVFQIGGWEGKAHLDENGRFQGCTIAPPWDGTVVLLLARDRTGFQIALYDPDWKLTIGDRYPVTVAVDRRWWAELEARVVGEQTVVIAFAEDPALDRLRRGNRLTVTAAQQAFDFGLRGSNAAIGALLDCYATYTGGPAVARAPNPAGPAGESAPADATARAPELATGVYRRPLSLTLSDVEEMVRTRIAPSARVWRNEQRPPYYEFFGARGIRDNGPVSGKVMEVDVPSGLIELAMTTLYAEELSRCGDGGESGRLPAESYPDLDLQYAIIRCGTKPGDRQVELVLMLIDTYGILYVIEGGNADTIRMADLVLAIQQVGRGVGR